MAPFLRWLRLALNKQSVFNPLCLCLPLRPGLCKQMRATHPSQAE